MNSFLWRNMTVFVRGKELIAMDQRTTTLPDDDIVWTMLTDIRHAHVFDQNTILVLCADDTVWRCGPNKTQLLVSASQAGLSMIAWVKDILTKMAPNQYAQVVEQLEREFYKLYPKKEGGK